MYVVPRSWLRLFFYSAFALVVMSVLWLVISNRFDHVHLSRLEMRKLAGNGILNDTKDDLDQHTVTQAMNTENNFSNKSANKWTKLHSIGNRNIIEIENQNYGRNDISKTPLKIQFTNEIKQDTTKRFPLENKRSFPSPNTSSARLKKTSVAHFQKTTNNVYSSKPWKQGSFYFRSRHAKVYGEPGCPDNPWREGLSELVHEWVNISKQHSIEYVLACGSLLGAMRDSDVIPYDSDVDILIDINYYPVLKRLAGERRYIASSDEKMHLVLQPEFTLNIPVESRKRYDCQGKETPSLVDECSFQEPMGRLFKGNLHIDIFHFYERVHYVEDPSESKLKQYKKNDFYPFRSCSFMGYEASCPNKPWEILRLYLNTDNFEPIYKCKNGTWVDKDGLAADVF